MLAMIRSDPFSAAGTYESCFLNIGQALILQLQLVRYGFTEPSAGSVSDNSLASQSANYQKATTVVLILQLYLS